MTGEVEGGFTCVPWHLLPLELLPALHGTACTAFTALDYRKSSFKLISHGSEAVGENTIMRESRI